MKCLHCDEDVSPNNSYCGRCGKKVKIDDHGDKIKKCPSCNSLQKLAQSFCTDCGFKFGKDKIIICQAKKDNGEPCGSVVTSKFCGVCGKSVEDKKQDSTQDKTPDSTQDKTPDNTQDKTPDSTQDKTPDSTQDKTQDDELDGGHNSKQKQIEVIQSSKNPERKIKVENVELQKEAPTEKNWTQGLAVICTHRKFDKDKFQLQERKNAEEDNLLMTEAWKLYGCEVLSFADKKNEFYKDDLIEKIKDKLKGMEKLDYFVMVLSTHGDESHEVNLKDKKTTPSQYHHYFYTRDGRYRTQDVIDAIGELPELDEKLKMFFIQACRSRFTNTEVENQDIGHIITMVPSSEKQHNGTDQSNDVGHMPVEDNKKAQLISKNKSIDVEDARGYMPPPEKENDSSSEHPNRLPTTIEKKEDQMATPPETTEIEEVIEFPTTVAIPHCDDCVVVFASMTGKYAYSRIYDNLDGGGWMLRALHSTMIKQQKPGDIVYILDILTGINREISRKENVHNLRSNQMDENRQRQIYRSYLDVLLKNVDQTMKKEVSSQQLLLKVKEYLDQDFLALFESEENLELLKEKKNLELLKEKKDLELDDLKLLKVKENREHEDHEFLKVKDFFKLLKVNEDLRKLCLKVEVEQEIYKLEDEIKEIQERVERFIGAVTIKAQSCFFHNLAFEDEHMKLMYQDKVQST